MAIRRLEHVGVTVKSIEASAAFYEKVLGLRLTEVRQPNPNTRLGFLGFPDRAGSVIELVERAHAEIPGERSAQHIAFTVEDVEAEIARMAALGVTFMSEQASDRVGKWRTIYFLQRTGRRAP